MRDWIPDWSDETCVIVASGPSASGVYLERAKGKARVIAINRSWELCPWADILYSCDFNYWRLVQGLPQFQGLKLTAERRDMMEPWGIRHVEIIRHLDSLVMGPPGTIGSGGNSGFQGINLAVQFGCKRIVLVGYDMRVDLGLHWHGSHPKGMNNPSPNNIGRWRRSVDNAATQLEKLGITVVNCSKVSALKNYPLMEFDAVFADV